MLIGREHELALLCAAIAERRSLLICGPTGAGKSALLQNALSCVEENHRRKCVVCEAEGTPIAIWQRMMRALAAVDDQEVLTRVENEAGSYQQFERWLRDQTSLRLRGILRRAARAREYSIFLEAAAPLPDGAYRLLQEWVWSARTPVILLGRGLTVHELGKAAQLYWHEGLRLNLGPLEWAPAKVLLEHSISRFDLAELADEEFRDFVLKQSERLPGRIAMLCELASNTAYQHEGHVKLHTLAVDFLLQQRPPAERTAGHA
jgi:energy-coupling factor transporter ATP-binding protein EcfA2